MLAANTAGTVATPTPLLLFHSDTDTVVPIADSDTLMERLCAAGQVVERRVVSGGTHGTTIIDARNEGLPWLTGLADGTTTPTTNCAS